MARNLSLRIIVIYSSAAPWEFHGAAFVIYKKRTPSQSNSVLIAVFSKHGIKKFR